MRIALGALLTAVGAPAIGASQAAENPIPHVARASEVRQRLINSRRQTGAHVAVPEGDIGRWFGPDAYPTWAQRTGEQGRVVAQLAIAANGHVARCKIMTSSGSDSLDKRTCEIALARLTFRPPLDRRGRRLVSNYLLPIRWVLPENGPSEAIDGKPAVFHGQAILIEQTIDAEGRFVSCRSKGLQTTGNASDCRVQSVGDQATAR